MKLAILITLIALAILAIKWDNYIANEKYINCDYMVNVYGYNLDSYPECKDILK